MSDVIGYRIFMHGGFSGGGHGGGYTNGGSYKGSKWRDIPPWKLETIFDGEETLPMKGVLGIKDRKCGDI